MKTYLQKPIFILLIGIGCILTQKAYGQTTSDTINWDLQYFKTLPATGVNYMMGVNSMRMSWTAAASNTNTFLGRNALHTGEVTSFGRGNDVMFNVSAGADTLVFADTVRTLKFSIYDIDVRQNVTITAKDISGTAINITTLAKANILSTITIAGSGTTSASATSQVISLDIANNSDLATVNVTINGPVKTVILTFTKNNTTADPIWISDISANVVGSWPTNYQTVSTPEAGQHSYVIANKHNKILVLDLNDTTTSVLYTDAAFQRINSIAYDPYKQVVYYCDQYAINTNKTVYKYDVKTGVKSVAIADITTLGVVLESGGVGSGGGSFYNGSLFLGVDANTGLGEAAAIWRIDFNSSGVATKASRFWGVYANDSIAAATYLYNWGDYVINNGILYNFNVGYAAVANTQAQHIDMNTQKYIANYSTSRVWQTGIDYAGNIYNIGNDSIAVYNAGVLSGKRKVRSYVAGDSTFDAAESFKYPYDFGDAPTSYGTPFHLYNTSPTLKLGSTIDYEVNDTTNATANADDNYNTGATNDEDGKTTFNPISTSWYSYSTTMNVTNTTGANATLYGYIDFNRDGDFVDAGEKSSPTTVPNAATSAVVIWTGLTAGSLGSSFIRFRIASSASEVSSPFGYAANGEDEDYPFPINQVNLPVELVDFKGKLKEDKTTLLTWSTASELNNDYFDVQRKIQGGSTWENIGKIDGFGNSNHFISYNFIDNQPQTGENYYRLNQVDFNGKSEYSPTIMIKLEAKITDKKAAFVLYPNPVKNEIWIKSEDNITTDNQVPLDVYDITGERMYSAMMQENLQHVDLTQYQRGIYIIKIGSQVFKIRKE